MSTVVLDEIRESPIQKVKVAVTDIDGVLRGKYLHKDKFLSAAKTGFGFCDVVFGWDSGDILYDNVQFTGWHTGYPDAQAMIALETFRRIPWNQGIPFFLADFVTSSGEPLEICPRQTLKKVLKKAEKMGFRVMTGFEFEWFNFKESPESLQGSGYNQPQPLTPGMFGYSLLRMTQNQPFFSALMDDMLAFGIPIEGLHTETGPGVFEAAINYSDALEAADRAVLFKTAAKEIGGRFGIMPSFMAKWNPSLPGCSGHMHLSLSDGKDNLFFSDQAPNNMSNTFRSFLAGTLHCLPQLLPLYAPTVNSYKRLVDGYWAPTKPVWGVDNRTAAARVIRGGAKATRMELRVAGADINPYLALAAFVASGLYGVEQNLKLESPPIQGSAYTDTSVERLPRNLADATEFLDRSELARDLLGKKFIDHFVATRIWEWRQFQSAVTNWELARYFEII